MNFKKIIMTSAALLAAGASFAASAIEKLPMQPDGMLRLARIEVHAKDLPVYLEAARKVGEISLKTEPGVLLMFSMQDKKHPEQITIIESYASADAYKSHIASAHFQEYKNGTLSMVKSLELTDQVPLNPKSVLTNTIAE